MVFTSDGVGVGVGVASGVVRALMTWWKSKIGVVSGVISATESESEESERFHFFRLRGIGTLFSLDHKLYASDYGSDPDSVASENQPLHENMSAGLTKRGRAKALAPPFLSPVSSHFPVRAFSILGTRLSRSLEQSKGVTEYIQQ